MHRPLEQLRLAVGLAHAVPGARLDLHCADGGRVAAGTEPGCDLDLCALRRIVLGSMAPSSPDITRHLARIEIGGSLRPDAAGIHRTVGPEASIRWFATTLDPDQVFTLLGQLPDDSGPGWAVEAGLRPDRCLGVTVVRMAVDTDRAPGLLAEPTLDQVALRAFEACLTRELMAAAVDGARRVSGDDR